MFLYSQDLSNCTTQDLLDSLANVFLYSQDLSNCTTTPKAHQRGKQVFVLSRFK